MIDEEGELMRRVARDEPEAFPRLVALVLPRLLGFFRRLGADAALAEDCAQEVLLKLFRVRAGYEQRARFVTYLLHVARNHWIDVYRHRRAGPRVVSVEALGSDAEDERGFSGSHLPAAAGTDASSGALTHELRVALDRALARLSAEHREAFVLAHLEALRYEELATILGIPVGTVKSRVHAATRQLREQLEREGFEP